MPGDAKRREAQITEEAIRRARGCPDAEILADYGDRTLPSHDHERIASHVAECAACGAAIEFLESAATAEVQEAEEIPSQVEQRLDALVREQAAPLRPQMPLMMKAAAVVTIAIGLGVAGYLTMFPGGAGRDLGTLRDQGSFEALLPDGRLEAPPEEFTWSAHPMAEGYSVIVVDESLEEIWRAATAGPSTTLRITEEQRRLLTAGGRFSWQVVALDRGGLILKRSPFRHFEIAPTSPTR